MKTLFIQLNDAHIRSIEDPVLQRVEQIVAAVRGETPQFDSCFVLVVGDIAMSGQKSEYELADLFLDEIRRRVKSIQPGASYDELHVPGNHDCDFSKSGRLRVLAINEILKSGVSAEDEDYVDQCTIVQENYFNFSRKRQGLPRVQSGFDRLKSTRSFRVGDKTVVFKCFNSAWMSQLRERQGELVPFNVEVGSEPQADLTVGLFHHPYNWMQADAGREFKRRVESSCDLVFTGHEHDPYMTVSANPSGSITSFIEGGVLQESDRDVSSFNLLLLNWDKRTYDASVFNWNGSNYTKGATVEDRDISTHGKGRKAFEITDAFFRELRDPGAGYKHPVKDVLSRNDFYVAPDIEFKIPGKSASQPSILESASRINLKGQKLLVIGEERSGRTALGRYLFDRLSADDLLPIWVEGSALKKATDRKIRSAIDEGISKVYGNKWIEPYNQLDRAKKAIIVDDLDDSGLNRDSLNEVLSALSARFDSIILLADALYPLEQQFQDSRENNLLLSHRIGRIMPFGHRLRGQLIEKWMTLGRDSDELDNDHFREVKEAEDFVKTALGKSLMPRYPLIILTMIQSYEAQKTNTAASGSYGYYFKSLIDSRIALAYETSDDPSRLPPPDSLRTFVSMVAFRMYQDNERSLDRTAMESVFNDYKAQVGYTLPPEKVIPLLQTAELLVLTPEENFRFKYTYISCYFVAYYLSERIHRTLESVRIRQVIAHLSSRLHVETYSSIMVYLVYLTKDEETINNLIRHASGLFRDYKPCDIQSDVKVFNEMVDAPAPMSLDQRGAPAHLKALRIQADALEHYDADKTNLATRYDYSEEEEDAQLEQVLQLNVSFKTLQVLGQVLRNSFGSLDAGLKARVTEHCFLLSLRTLTFINDLLTSSAPLFRDVFKKYLRDEFGMSDIQEINEMADNYVFSLANICSLGVVRRVSQAVGSEHLKETYEEVGSLGAPVALGLINTAIRLDHFRAFPRSEIKVLGDICVDEKNFVAYNVLRQLVIDHFILVLRPLDVRNSVCKELNIENQPAAFGGRTNKDR